MSLTPEEQQMVERLRSLGVDIAIGDDGDWEIDTVARAHNLATPHRITPLHRLSMPILPDYRVVAFGTCVICGEDCYVSDLDFHQIMGHDHVPVCMECLPSMRHDMDHSGKPTAEFIRELLRQSV